MMIGIKDIGLLLARLLLALIFVHEGFTLLTHFASQAAYMSEQGIPMPVFALVIALQLSAGLALVFGFLMRPGSLSLGLFCVATAFLFHTNLESQNELLHFEKDLGLAGGMLALTIAGAGRISFDRVVEPWLLGRIWVAGHPQ